MTNLSPKEAFTEVVTIINWREYQHDVARDKAPWMRLYRSLMDNPEYWMLSDFEARLLILIWLVALEKGLPKEEDTLTFKNQTFAQFLRWRLRYPESKLVGIEEALDNIAFQGFINLVHNPVNNALTTSSQPCEQDVHNLDNNALTTSSQTRELYKTRLDKIRFTADAAGDEVEEEIVESATNSSQEDDGWSQLDEEWAEWDREHPNGEESSQEEEDECRPVSTISLPEPPNFEEYKRNKIIQAMSDTSEPTQFKEDDSWMEDTPEPSLEDEPADPMAMLLGMVDQLTQSPAVEQEEPSGWDEEEEPEPLLEYHTDDQYLERVWHTHNFIATQFYNASTPWKVDWSTFSQRSANEQVTEILRGYAWTLIENQVHPDDFVHYYYTQWFNYKNESLAFNKEGKPLTETPGIGFPSRKWLCEMGDEVVAKLLDNPGWKSDYFPYPEEFGEVANA